MLLRGAREGMSVAREVDRDAVHGQRRQVLGHNGRLVLFDVVSTTCVGLLQMYTDKQQMTMRPHIRTTMEQLPARKTKWW